MKLELHHLPPSPNNLRVRLALGYKRLAYTSVPFHPTAIPGNRAEQVELSRQPRLPILKHGETVIFDSFSILRYLEANFPETLPIYSTDYDLMGSIERWELHSRTVLAEPIGVLFGQAVQRERDQDVIAGAGKMFRELTGHLEGVLDRNDYIEGNTLTAADLALVPLAALATLSEAQAAASPLLGFFRENLSLGAHRERTADWIARVLSHESVGEE